MKVRVREGYVLFIGSKEYLGGTILEVTEEEIATQSWKVEPILEQKTVDKTTTKDRMVKSKETTKK